MPAPEFANWRKSSRSGPNNGNCVEVGFADEGAVIGVRDTKEAANPSRPTLVIGGDEWASFLGAVRSGRLDLPR